MPRDSQCHLVKKYVIPSQNTVFGGGAGNSLRKKCESFSYSHVGINVVSFNLKTRPGDCTPHKDRDISEANDEFLMCAALKTAIVQVFMKEKQKKCDVREENTSRTSRYFCFFA